mgnify:FL=1
MNNATITRPSDNYSRIPSSSVNSICCDSNDNDNFKINKEDYKYKDAKVETTSTEASEITQKKENRKETRKED